MTHAALDTAAPPATDTLVRPSVAHSLSVRPRSSRLVKLDTMPAWPSDGLRQKDALGPARCC